MDVSEDKKTIVRPVQQNHVSGPKKPVITGVIFERLEETNCPHCKAVIALGDAQPLSWLDCPACGLRVLVPGQVGGFVLHEHIGEGAMGTIYRATDKSLEREVAVKLVRGCHIDDPLSRQRLQSEACAAGKVNHPRVAQVYALNFSNGHPYLVMELVSGQDFEQKLKSEGRIDERTALKAALDVADGLSALNREGLVHGDIKPGNIVLDRDENAKLVDFGLSGMTRHDDNGFIVGTPTYIAPELLRGEEDTHLSDIYSLGATLYHLLSGRLPFDGESSEEILKARLSKPLIPLGKHTHDVSFPTQKLVIRMLQRDGERRYPSSEAVAADIREALALLDAPASITTPAKSPEISPSKEPKLSHQADLSKESKLFRWKDLLEFQSRHRIIVRATLCLIAAMAIFVAVRERSFFYTWAWLRDDAYGHMKTLASSITAFYPGNDEPEKIDFTAGINLRWRSINLGNNTQRGSTMQVGDVMVVQGTGMDMWSGADNCRFVWTKASQDYAFAARIQTIAERHKFDLSALLVKGDDPSAGPGILFGFLGDGKVFLQIRHPDSTVELIKCSQQSIRVPAYLKIIRRGKEFETLLSADGNSWETFSICELKLPSHNKIGLAVSSQDPGTPAMAKFSNITLVPAEWPVAPKLK